MTVQELYDRMTVEELIGWAAFMEMQRLERENAQRRMERRR
jgi:ABC-type Na+ transport system ATPase subunit NatA